MDKIIEKLFNIHIQADDFLLVASNKENSILEWQLYDSLLNNLPVDKKETFIEYIGLCNQRQKKEILFSYEQGFKTAIRLILESINK